MAATIVFVHGLRTSATMWRRQLEELRSLDIPATGMDLPGHGSRMGERFTLDAAMESIGAAVAHAARDGEKPYLCGFSLGGYLSIEWAARNPGAIGGLLAASCGTSPNRVLLDGWRAVARGIHALPDRGRRLNDFMVRVFVPPEGARDVLAGGVALEVMDDVLRELRPLKPMVSLARIDVPVLFVNGRWDHFRLHAHRYLSATQNGRLVTMQRSSHMVSVVQPELFLQLLLDDYTRVTAGTSAP